MEEFKLDIHVEPIQEQNTSRGNSYTTACNCASTSCIDDERTPAPARCPDD